MQFFIQPSSDFLKLCSFFGMKGTPISFDGHGLIKRNIAKQWSSGNGAFELSEDHPPKKPYAVLLSNQTVIDCDDESSIMFFAKSINPAVQSMDQAIVTIVKYNPVVLSGRGAHVYCASLNNNVSSLRVNVKDEQGKSAFFDVKGANRCVVGPGVLHTKALKYYSFVDDLGAEYYIKQGLNPVPQRVQKAIFEHRINVQKNNIKRAFIKGLLDFYEGV